MQGGIGRNPQLPDGSGFSSGCAPIELATCLVSVLVSAGVNLHGFRWKISEMIAGACSNLWRALQPASRAR